MRLIVFWTLCELGDQEFEFKQYKRTRMRSEFPLEVNPEDAKQIIYNTYGRQKEHGDGYKPISWTHRYADIHGYSITETFTRDQEKIETYQQIKLL